MNTETGKNSSALFLRDIEDWFKAEIGEHISNKY